MAVWVGVSPGVEPCAQAGKYITALMGDLPRKNGWTIAEHAGDSTPDRTQRLLNHAVWDARVVEAVVRGFVAVHLAGEPLVVGALDESGQQKQGDATAGVKRQYMGCAGRVANRGGPVLWLRDHPGARPGRCPNLGAGRTAGRRGPPGRAGDSRRCHVQNETTAGYRHRRGHGCRSHDAPWFAGDEVYGRSSELRDYLETQGAGYVMRAGCDFRTQVTPGVTERADALVTRLFTGKKHRKRWEVHSVAGSKGARAYAWAWISGASDRHYLLIRKHLTSGELAYHYCYVPPGRPVTLMTLVRVACLRWPVEEDFEFGKDHFGLDHSQVRHYTACSATSCSPWPPSPSPRREPKHPSRSCRTARMRSHQPTPASSPCPSPRSNDCSTCSPAHTIPRNTTCTGPSGDDATKYAPDGSTTEPDSSETTNQHDQLRSAAAVVGTTDNQSAMDTRPTEKFTHPR
jgi:hypothetical protein